MSDLAQKAAELKRLRDEAVARGDVALAFALNGELRLVNVAHVRSALTLTAPLRK